MTDDLDYRLTQTIEKMRVRQKAQSDLRSIENELRQALPRLQSLEEKLKKEQVDVNKLEKTSLSSLWASLRGSLEADLTREQLELTAAQAAYQQHARRVNDLRAEHREWCREQARSRPADPSGDRQELRRGRES